MSNRAFLLPTIFARQLLAYEAAAGRGGKTKDSTAFRVCEELRGPLEKLLGVGGFRSLLARALTLGSTEVPWLRTLQINANGSLEGLEKEVKRDARGTAQGELILVGHLLALLVTFIGPALTLGLVHDVWPGWKIETLKK